MVCEEKGSAGFAREMKDSLPIFGTAPNCKDHSIIHFGGRKRLGMTKRWTPRLFCRVKS